MRSGVRANGVAVAHCHGLWHRAGPYGDAIPTASSDFRLVVSEGYLQAALIITAMRCLREMRKGIRLMSALAVIATKSSFAAPYNAVMVVGQPTHLERNCRYRDGDPQLDTRFTC